MRTHEGEAIEKMKFIVANVKGNGEVEQVAFVSVKVGETRSVKTRRQDRPSGVASAKIRDTN
jgi:predicted Holliday junction resolvase-like endonuclease